VPVVGRSEQTDRWATLVGLYSARSTQCGKVWHGRGAQYQGRAGGVRGVRARRHPGPTGVAGSRRRVDGGGRIASTDERNASWARRRDRVLPATGGVA